MEPEEVLEEQVDHEVEQEVEQETEQPTQQENTVITTGGKWMVFERFTQHHFEDGKTYRIHVNGTCEFAVSAEKPVAGIATNEITFTKQPDVQLWIKTGA